MADTIFVAQDIEEVAAGDSNTRVAQGVNEVGSDGSSARIAQDVNEVGAGDSNSHIAQTVFEEGANNSNTRIAQVTIELGRGPEVIPPSDNPIGTFTVGAGLGVDWFLALQLSDSGDELRDKVVKSFRATGKFSNSLLKGYTYGPLADIAVTDIEEGSGQKVTVAVPDTAQVQQTKRFQVNLPNAMMHTLRIEGRWSGEGIPDRIDELIYEVSRQGVRR